MYICTLRCPHFAEPCEMETAEYERIASYKEPCPIGEDDSFRYVDESKYVYLSCCRKPFFYRLFLILYENG